MRLFHPGPTVCAMALLLFAASSLGCSDYVEGEDNAFDTEEGAEFNQEAEDVDDEVDLEVPEFEVDEACDWEDAHPWDGPGGGLDRRFRSVAGGPSSLSEVEQRIMPVRAAEVRDDGRSVADIRSIAVASSGMTVILYRFREGAGDELVLKAYDGEGEELWGSGFGDIGAATEQSVSLLDGCQLLVTLDDRLYLVDGAAGTVEEELALPGSALGSPHIVDGDSAIVATNIAEGTSKMQISVQSVERDLGAMSTVYEGSEYAFSEFNYGPVRTVYDELRGLLFVPAPVAHGHGSEEGVGGEVPAGMVGIDLDEGVVDMTVMPEREDLLDGHSSGTGGGFSAVYPFGSDGRYLYFHADSLRVPYLGAVDLERQEVVRVGQWEILNGSEGNTPVFQGFPSHTIANGSRGTFSYGSHGDDALVAVDGWGESGGIEVDDHQGGAAWRPSLVSDARGSTYLVGGEANLEVMELSADGQVVDSIEVDDAWRAMRPVAIGVEETLLLVGTQRQCDEEERCVETKYVVVMGN